MKSCLVIGNSAAFDRLQKIIYHNPDISCFHATYMFSAVKLLYERTFDVLIISSEILRDDKIDFVHYIDKQFSKIRILISLDNGMDSTFRFPDRAQLISEHELDDLCVSL